MPGMASHAVAAENERPAAGARGHIGLSHQQGYAVRLTLGRRPLRMSIDEDPGRGVAQNESRVGVRVAPGFLQSLRTRRRGHAPGGPLGLLLQIPLPASIDYAGDEPGREDIQRDQAAADDDQLAPQQHPEQSRSPHGASNR